MPGALVADAGGCVEQLIAEQCVSRHDHYRITLLVFDFAVLILRYYVAQILNVPLAEVDVDAAGLVKEGGELKWLGLDFEEGGGGAEEGGEGETAVEFCVVEEGGHECFALGGGEVGAHVCVEGSRGGEFGGVVDDYFGRVVCW